MYDHGANKSDTHDTWMIDFIKCQSKQWYAGSPNFPKTQLKTPFISK